MHKIWSWEDSDQVKSYFDEGDQVDDDAVDDDIDDGGDGVIQLPSKVPFGHQCRERNCSQINGRW